MIFKTATKPMIILDLLKSKLASLSITIPFSGQDSGLVKRSVYNPLPDPRICLKNSRLMAVQILGKGMV
jgi:hypothetical protein